MENKENIYDYEANIIDIDEVQGTDVKINPDFYIHTALLKAQTALSKDNMKEGMLQYRIIIEHIEVLCKAANMIPNTYDAEIEAFTKTDEMQKEKEDFVKSTKIATKKLELLMTAVFSHKTSTSPLHH
jgi:hypothetical protein